MKNFIVLLEEITKLGSPLFTFCAVFMYHKWFIYDPFNGSFNAYVYKVKATNRSSKQSLSGL